MSQLPEKYISIVNELKNKISSARQKASLHVNRELLLLYWEIGHIVLIQQENEGWGAKVISRLAVDLKSEFPDFRGLSDRNLKYMRAFARAYPDLKEIVQQPTAQLDIEETKPIVQSPIAQLSWTHHVTLLDKVKDKETRLFYINKAVENHWSKNVMVLQIESNLHKRVGTAFTNFELTLPESESDLAQETIKSPYIFDFLSFDEKIKEKDLEAGLINNIKEFLLELGNGFAYVGNQKNLVVEGDDFFLDLLFYNYHLHCFVIFELKIGEFKPEFAGKLNFYINTVNNQLKGEFDTATIGVLLCKTPNETVVKFSLQNITQPMGVAEFKLKPNLPKELKGKFPTALELSSEVEKEFEKIMRPVYQKMDKLKKRLDNLKRPEAKERKSEESIRNVFDNVISPFYETLMPYIDKNIKPLFTNIEIGLRADSNSYNSLEIALLDFGLSDNKLPNNNYSIWIFCRGLKKAGIKAFDFHMELTVGLEQYSCWAGIKSHSSNQDKWLEKLYDQAPSDLEIKDLVDRFLEYSIDELSKRVESIEDHSR